MEVGIFEGRNRFSELIEAAEAGEEVVVLRRGRAVAKIVPVSDPEAIIRQRLDALQEATARADGLAEKAGRTFTHAEMIAARDEGKR